MSTDNQENPSGPECHDPSAMWRALTRLHAATVTSHDFTDYIRHLGDRTDLFLAVAAHTGARRAIYPGSYLDLTPSCALPDVTYLDSDTRACKAFADSPPSNWPACTGTTHRTRRSHS
ncbi:hypothetical protein ACFXA3_09295 [Streptomyces sp. NPDC059456]|uniref:hypothetical protein n=1 Tax=Streptomyces sp. NPDC059456 TaxID=3346838 RepID=UPI0036C685EB